VRAERFAFGAPKSPQTKFSKPYLVNVERYLKRLR
jgi:hypothetical protein